MSSFILSLGTSGLNKSDLVLRLYRNADHLTDLESPITVTEIGTTGDYFIDHLPQGLIGYWYALTYEYPPGAGGAYRWPDQEGMPPNVVLPIREVGLGVEDLDLALYKDGEEQDVDFSATELGGVGDYSVSGWSTTAPDPGAYVLRWSRYGITYSIGWTVPVPAPTTGIFIAEFLSLLSDTVLATPGYLDAYGGFTPSGEILSLPCHIEGETRLVRDRMGREVTSTVQLIVGGVYDLTTDTYRYTLPARFDPRDDIQAIAVERASDEVGPAYECVILP